MNATVKLPPNVCGVYQIRNVVTGERYIGGSVQVRIRCRQHLRERRSGYICPKSLHDAFAEFGESAFVFELLLVCSRGDLAFYEGLLIDNLVPSYNMRKVREVDHAPKTKGHNRGNSLASY